MKLKQIMILCMMCLMPITSASAYAQTGPGFDMILDKSHDDICWKIESLYENEPDINLREMEIHALKEIIHPERYNTYLDYKYLCRIPYNEKLKYNLAIIGFDSSYPRYSVENNSMGIYGKSHTLDEIEQYKADINELYDFISQVKVDTEGYTTEQKIAYLQELLSKRLKYSAELNYAYKANDVLRSNSGVCTGYSNLFYLCCINIGIPCECVGNMDHMWNRVWINDEWRYIDCTWNDTVEENKWYLIKQSELDDEHLLLNIFQ